MLDNDTLDRIILSAFVGAMILLAFVLVCGCAINLLG